MNGKAVYVEGGRGWEFMDGLDASMPVWLGKEPAERIQTHLKHVAQVSYPCGVDIAQGSAHIVHPGRWVEDQVDSPKYPNLFWCVSFNIWLALKHANFAYSLSWRTWFLFPTFA